MKEPEKPAEEVAEGEATEETEGKEAAPAADGDKKENDEKKTPEKKTPEEKK
jgi:large subunit ribosomal protein L25